MVSFITVQNIEGNGREEEWLRDVKFAGRVQEVEIT